ncbi:MAG: glycosyltransferase [Planctomycetes bacterium]|nr:glycosyltransferase [Planctomycetota bacterium]
MNAPLVSVIIPVYNRLDFVREAIDSVVRQTVDDKEIIIVDDGSDENMSEFLRSLDSKEFFVVRKSHRGIASARNTGVNVSKGRWIAFLDDDDTWAPEKLEIQLGYAETKPHKLLFGTAFNVIQDGKETVVGPWNYSEGYVFRTMIESPFILTSSMIVKRNLFFVLGGYDETLQYATDYDFLLRASKLVPVGFLRRILVNYRLHGSNTKSFDKRKSLVEISTVLSRLMESEIEPDTQRVIRHRLARTHVQLARLHKADGEFEQARMHISQAFRIERSLKHYLGKVSLKFVRPSKRYRLPFIPGLEPGEAEK